MANTSIATSHNLTNEQWEASLYKTYQEKTFFSKFKGVGQGSVVQVKRDLIKKPGDAITFGLSDTIRGTSGVTGNTPIEGTVGTGADSAYQSNYEAMSFYDQRVVIDQVRQAIKISGIMDEKRVAFSMRNEAKDKLVDWMSYNEDQALFTALQTADTVGTVASGSTIDLDGGLTYDNIVDMKKEAMFPTTGNIDGTATTRKLEPIRVDGGEEVFVLIANPADCASFRKSDDFKNFNQNADVRGSSNAIFTGMLGKFNNVVIHEHSSITAGKPVLVGANALFLAYGKEIMYGEDTFDYSNQTGFMIGSIRGVALAKFEDQSDNSQGSHGAIVFDLTTE